MGAQAETDLVRQQIALEDQITDLKGRLEVANRKGRTDVPAVIRARCFELVDGAGTVRADLSMDIEDGTDHGNPGFTMYGPTGQRRAWIGVNECDSAYLVFYGDNGPQVCVEIEEGDAYIMLHGRGSAGIELGVTKDGNCTVDVRDRRHSPVWQVRTEPAEAPVG